MNCLDQDTLQSGFVTAPPSCEQSAVGGASVGLLFHHFQAVLYGDVGQSKQTRSWTNLRTDDLVSGRCSAPWICWVLIHQAPDLGRGGGADHRGLGTCWDRSS